jgi:thiol-disulfide isomerase/thioredoxin
MSLIEKIIVVILMLQCAACENRGRNSLSKEDFNKLLLINTNPSAQQNILKRIKVVVFFSYHCPMCLKQIPRLHQIQRKYSKDVEIDLVIPEKRILDSTAFGNADIFAFNVYLDSDFSLVRKLSATATPHYFIYSDNALCYSGAFDNSYSRISVPQQSEEYRSFVEEVIDAILGDTKIKEKETKPVGCYIDIDG